MTTSKVSFRNKPKLSEYEIQKEFNEKRLSLVPEIEHFLSHHSRFADATVTVTFSDKGVGSLVCMIDTEREKVVLKIPLSNAAGEGLFLKTWEQAGARVPHVIEEGKLSGYTYILMEYIDAPLLSEADSSDAKNKLWNSLEMGRVLRTMHIPKAEGFGRVIDNKAEYQTFSEWLASKEMRDARDYMEENRILAIEPSFIDAAFSILTEHADQNQSSYCHFDFGGSNIFATNPITVFDPNPQFNNGYLDLGLSVFNSISAGAFPEQLVEGYFEGETYDEKVLYASVLLNSYIKLPSRHKKKKFDHIENIQRYLIQNKHLLEE